MIELLWNQDDLETQDGTKRLADFSLLDLDLHTGTVHLHDEIRFYVGPTISNGAPCTQGLSTELEIPKISAVATLYAGFHGTSPRRVEMLRDVLCSSTSSGC